MTTKNWAKLIIHPTAVVLFIAAIMLAGCATHSGDSGDSAFNTVEAGSTNSAATASTTAPGEPPPFQPGDALTIGYYDTPTGLMPWEGEIKPDGTITLLLNETFKAAGLTTAQLEKTIRERYVPRFFKQMTVAVKPKQDTRFYYVGGAVRSPGRSVYLSRITILKAIQSAGDFNDFANKKKVQLTRSGASKPIIVNCIKAREQPALDLEIYPGDRIHVPQKIF